MPWGSLRARWLVERGARHLVLVGRGGARDKATAVLAEFERQGVSVRVARADVADESQMKTLFAEMARSMPPLAGLIDAAGVVEDGLIGQLAWENFERVFAPKVQGAWNLHRLTENLKLDFFVLFSSAASFFGSPGQANYSAANSFLDALAGYRHALNLPALSVNWGPWEGDGMASEVDDVHRRRWLKWGAGGIDAKSGTIALERALNSRNPEIAVVRMDWSALQSGGMTPALRDFTASFLHEAAPATIPDRTISRATLLGLAPDERVPWVLGHVSQMLETILGLPPNSLDLDQGLGELGFDSLMALELKNRLDSTLESGVSMARLLSNPTARQIANLVAELIEPGDSAKAATREPKLAAVTAEIEEGEL